MSEYVCMQEHGRDYINTNSYLLANVFRPVIVLQLDSKLEIFQELNISLEYDRHITIYLKNLIL